MGVRKFTFESHNLDGTGHKKVRVYTLPVVNPCDFWESVTDVPCPCCSTMGLIRWAEAGYVAGYRICEGCGRHFLAKGNAENPKLLRVGNRISKVKTLV